MFVCSHVRNYDDSHRHEVDSPLGSLNCAVHPPLLLGPLWKKRIKCMVSRGEKGQQFHPPLLLGPLWKRDQYAWFQEEKRVNNAILSNQRACRMFKSVDNKQEG